MNQDREQFEGAFERWWSNPSQEIVRQVLDDSNAVKLTCKTAFSAGMFYGLDLAGKIVHKHREEEARHRRHWWSLFA